VQVPQPAVPVPVPAEDAVEDHAEETPPATPFVPFNAPRPQEFENANPNVNPRRGAPGPIPQPVQAQPPVPAVPQPYVSSPTGAARPGEMVQPAAGQVPGMPAGVIPGVQRPAQPTTPPPQD
jgi:hypothetical protein